MISLVLLLFKGLANNNLDVPFERLIILTQPCRVGVLDYLNYLVDWLVLQVVGDLAGEYLKEHNAECIYIRSSVKVQCVTDSLLRAHVVQRADELPDVRLECDPLGVRVGCSRDSEIKNLGFTIRRDEHIRRLEIAMDHALRVCMLNCVAQLCK